MTKIGKYAAKGMTGVVVAETTELDRLKKAVRQLCYLVIWTSDRLSPEVERLIWENLRIIREIK